MIVPQISGSKSRDKQRKPHEHAYAFPAEMTLGNLSAALCMTMRFFMSLCGLMDHISCLAAGIHSALFMLMLPAMHLMFPVINQIDDDSSHHGNHKEHRKDDQRLIRNHSQHHERLIPGRCDHHSHKRSETE